MAYVTFPNGRHELSYDAELTGDPGEWRGSWDRFTVPCPTCASTDWRVDDNTYGYCWENGGHDLICNDCEAEFRLADV